MMDNDFNTIKPVESLANVAGLTPTGQPPDRKRRQPRRRRDPEPGETPPNETAEKQASERDGESHTIDYCA